MKVKNQHLITAFSRKHADSREPLTQWLETTTTCEWSNFIDLKNNFPQCDYIPKSRYCFNIKGNSYRLLASISFKLKQVAILEIMTHAEYDKITFLKPR